MTDEYEEVFVEIDGEAYGVVPRVKDEIESLRDELRAALSDESDAPAEAAESETKGRRPRFPYCTSCGGTGYAKDQPIVTAPERSEPDDDIVEDYVMGRRSEPDGHDYWTGEEISNHPAGSPGDEPQAEEQDEPLVWEIREAEARGMEMAAEELELFLNAGEWPVEKIRALAAAHREQGDKDEGKGSGQSESSSAVSEAASGETATGPSSDSPASEETPPIVGSESWKQCSDGVRVNILLSLWREANARAELLHKQVVCIDADREEHRARAEAAERNFAIEHKALREAEERERGLREALTEIDQNAGVWYESGLTCHQWLHAIWDKTKHALAAQPAQEQGGSNLNRGKLCGADGQSRDADSLPADNKEPTT